jgi:hypothetical protein
LPPTAESVARHLVDHAETLSVNTLRQRLAALSQWHRAQGILDATKAPIVKKGFKGIQVLHSAQEKRAKPLQIEQLAQAFNALKTPAQQEGQKITLAPNCGIFRSAHCCCSGSVAILR